MEHSKCLINTYSLILSLKLSWARHCFEEEHSALAGHSRTTTMEPAPPSHFIYFCCLKPTLFQGENAFRSMSLLSSYPLCEVPSAYLSLCFKCTLLSECSFRPTRTRRSPRSPHPGTLSLFQTLLPSICSFHYALHCIGVFLCLSCLPS